MSKIAKAKEFQGYTTEQRTCKKCIHHTCSAKLPAWMRGHEKYDVDGVREKHMIQSDHRCAIGGFAVKMMASCSIWSKA
jgi:hypothetical protein